MDSDDRQLIEKNEREIGHMRLLILLLLATTMTSCSEQTENMDEWERQVAEQLEAERVSLYHHGSTTTTNGKLTGSENYLALDIYNSKVLDEIKGNDRLLNEQCEKIKDAVMALPELDAFPTFNKFQIGLIETHGFGIFKSKKRNGRLTLE